MKDRTPTWLIVLRFVPTIASIVDDIFTELREEKSKDVSPIDNWLDKELIPPPVPEVEDTFI